MAALRRNNFNRTRTAAYLNISRVALWKKMKRLGIEV
jgi:DNA-binding NtrC family response regulator